MSPIVEQMLEAGTFNLHFREPDPRRVQLALRKHAYLAACLHLGRVPDTPDVRQIRADLLAARNALPRTRPAASKLAERLRVYRSHRPPAGPPLALVLSRLDGLPDDQKLLISLAGSLFVSWPFEIRPAEFAASRATGSRMIRISQLV